MTQAVEIKVRGVRQLESGAARLFRNIEHATDTQAIKATADQVAATVRSRVPRKTGRLAASVHTEMSGGRGHVVMGEGLPYGKWIEFGARGGRKPRAGRYVYPTAKRTERALRKHCETTCQNEIRSMRWPRPM